ncbi:hypothetical protein Taro_029260 [Colocasia esculenta]|uniref:RING-type E3 ubiquitin transferase n=1 Tax=Colocasia esculenta TaxID=4460 RepID=A0A843VDD9_COLES|nr:hypothetical protein [Colocasia esculenta]
MAPDDCYYSFSCSAPSGSPAPSPFALPLPLPAPVPIPSSYLATKHQILRTLLLAVASVLATCALLLTYYAVLRRYRSLRRRQNAPASQPPAAQAPFDTDDDLRDELLAAGENDQPYHVWNIRTVGLDEHTIGAISVVAYRKADGVVEGTDCAVCLGEFHEGEMLRLLPKCSHAFHIPCIDTWLRSHLNCPLCRAPIVAPTSPPVAPVAASDPSYSASPSSSSASTEAGDQPGSSRGEPEIWVRIDLGDGVSGDGGGHPGSGAPPAENGGNRRATLQRVRRSVSMDPSALGGLVQRMGLVGISGDGGCKPTSEEHSYAAKEGARRGNNRRRASLVDLGPPEMERSMSTGGERHFPSIFSGRTRGAILPL